MKVVVVGAGYVGLVSGACFSEFGMDVLCVDADSERIRIFEAGGVPIYEPGLEAMVVRNREAGRLSFSRTLAGEVARADVVLLAVGTPSEPGGRAVDLSHVRTVAAEVATDLDPKQKRTVIVTKSTVPVGTAREIEQTIAEARPDLVPGRDFDVASNPEFLREGAAIEDFLHPDRVVCGVAHDHARSVLEELYAPLNLRSVPLVFTRRETAELIKYASNAFLAMKISFINEMADLCERTGADIQDLALGLGLDKRIGSKFLHPGPGFGGSCFPKDTRGLVDIAESSGMPVRLVEATIKVNEERKHALADKVRRALGGNLKGKRIAVLGITFKPNTDDLREAPSLVLVPELMRHGASVVAYDPAGMKPAREMSEFTGVFWATGAEEAIEGADALVVLTEWNEFRGLSARRIANLLKTPTVIDFRNVYRPADMHVEGIFYMGVGRPALEDG